MRERRANGPVPLCGDGHDHEDGGRQEEVLGRVEEPGEGQAVPLGLGLVQGAHEGAHEPVVEDVVRQQEDVHHACRKESGRGGGVNFTVSTPSWVRSETG